MNTATVTVAGQTSFRFRNLEFPSRVTLELTNHCNLSCVVCPRKYMDGPKGFLSFHLFKKVIDEIADHNGVALVPFFRGESLLHPECIKMLLHAKKKGIGPIQFTTNATLLTEKISRALLDLELDFVSFSVDSIDSETYGKIRRGANLETVLKNIQTFCDLRTRRRMDRPEIQVSVVKTKDTSGNVDNFIRYWQERVDRVRVYREHSVNGHFGSLERRDFFENRKPCLKPFTDMVIYWNGIVALCNHDWNRQNDLGSVEHRSIGEIWRSKNYQAVREAHLGKGELETLCEHCDHWESFYKKEGFMGELYVRGSGAVHSAF